MITEMKFRKHVSAGLGPNSLSGLHGKQALGKIAFPMPAHPASNIFVLLFLALVVVLMCFSPSYRIAVAVGPIWLLALICAFAIRQRRNLLPPDI
jgi:L-asparagine transporter-like permease